MSSLVHPEEVEGEIKIPLDFFPKALLEQIISTRQIPVMEICLDKVFIEDGVTIHSEWDKAHASFSFRALEITIKEAT